MDDITIEHFHIADSSIVLHLVRSGGRAEDGNEVGLFCLFFVIYRFICMYQFPSLKLMRIYDYLSLHWKELKLLAHLGIDVWVKPKATGQFVV